jgi:hypothetical protein
MRVETMSVNEQDVADPQVKAALKEALKEWLDDQFVLVGRWTVRAFMAALLGAMVYFIIIQNGFHR